MRNFDQATILFHLISLILITNFPSVISVMRWYTCNNASTYSAGSTYSSNLNKVMSDLVKNAPQTGFNTSFYGQSGNSTVYGLLQCAGKISQQDCAKCSQEARDRLQQLCVKDMGGRIWMGMCFLRYENYSFFSKVDLTIGQELENANVIARSKQSMFKATASNFLSKLSDQANKPANKGFAEGSTESSVSTIYGLVQCWQDISTKDCRSCLQKARDTISQCCSESQGAQALVGSCTVRYEIYPFYDSTKGNSTTPPPLSPSSSAPNGTSPKTSKDSSTKSLPIILGIVGGVVIALILCLFAMRSKLKSAISQRIVTPAQKESTLLKHEQIIFSLGEIKEATNNFNENNKLGGGDFGPVYRGSTRDGTKIAVKKLSGQGKQEFMNEVKLVANIQHRNLVKLLGCCAEGSERLLVFEYLPNKSLDTFVFDAEKKSQLDWQRRYNIIMGIARGLLYLHEDSHQRIIHRNIKASNILLDEEFDPKIAGFELATLFSEDQTHIQSKVAGTYGYMAPEYAMQGKLSVKVDIYSFGVLILEIVRGRKNIDTNFPEEMQTLLDWAWILYKNGNLVHMIDSTLKETCRQEEALRCIHVALLCTQDDPGIRPSISNAILMISSASATELGALALRLPLVLLWHFMHSLWCHGFDRCSGEHGNGEDAEGRLHHRRKSAGWEILGSGFVVGFFSWHNQRCRQVPDNNFSSPEYVVLFGVPMQILCGIVRSRGADNRAGA